MAACGTAKQPVAVDNLALRTALLELEQLEAPAGANPQQFAELKSALANTLRNNSAGKFTATVPVGASGAVTDLALAASGEYHLEWTYRNKGDYDQNKQVTVSDLSALGANLGKNTTSPDWASKAVAADGDGNGEINVSDITPIGANLLATVTRYVIQTTGTPGDEGSWSDLDEQSFELSSIPAGSALRRFSYSFGPSPGSWYRVVPVDGDARGGPSNAVQFALSVPNLTAVNPNAGFAGSSVSFSAVNGGGTPTSWSWDFGGGVIPNTSSAIQPTGTLAAAGVYNASVTASNAAGSDTFEFTLAVTNPEPPSIDDVQPQAGIVGAEVSFSAILSGGAVASYAWNFGGGASPNTASEISPLVTLGSAGTYPASLTVTNAGGSDTFDFDLNVTADVNIPPAASLTGSPPQGNPGDTVELDASASVDSDGTLAKFEWDLDGDGSYEYDSGTDPLASTTRPDPAGSRDVSVRVTDNEGALDEATLTLSSLPPPGSWQISTVHSTLHGVVGPPSLAEINGLPGIVFGENTSSGQIYPTYAYTSTDDASSGWDVIWVDSFAPECMSLAEVNGTPALAYTQLANGTIRYAYTHEADGSSGWSALQLGSTAATNIVSLAEIEGKPAIAYQGGTVLSYYYSSADDGSSGWQSVIIDDDYAQGASLVEVNGKGAIAYNGGLLPSMRKLHFAYNTVNGWQRVAIHAATDVDWTKLSLQVVAGTPAILWGDASTISLAHSTELAGNTGWSTLETNLAAHNSRSFSRAIAFNGHVYSALLSPQEKVSVGVSANSDGSGKWLQSDVDSAAVDGVSLAMVNGHPAVAYKLKASQEIRYAIYK